MFADTITLFNRYHSKTTGDTWYPHVLHTVELNTDKASIIAKYGTEASDSATMLVHYGYVTQVSYSETTDTTFDDAKTYYVLTDDEYVETTDTSFVAGTTYYEKSEEEVKAVENITYMPPKEWAKQTNDKLADTITFNDDAQYFDFFVVGDLGITSPVLDEDYAKGFYNDCNSKYDYCYAITSVGGAYKLIPHFEILAK